MAHTKLIRLPLILLAICISLLLMYLVVYVAPRIVEIDGETLVYSGNVTIKYFRLQNLSVAMLLGLYIGNRYGLDQIRREQKTYIRSQKWYWLIIELELAMFIIYTLTTLGRATILLADGGLISLDLIALAISSNTIIYLFMGGWVELCAILIVSLITFSLSYLSTRMLRKVLIAKKLILQ